MKKAKTNPFNRKSNLKFVVKASFTAKSPGDTNFVRVTTVPDELMAEVCETDEAYLALIGRLDIDNIVNRCDTPPAHITISVHYGTSSAAYALTPDAVLDTDMRVMMASATSVCIRKYTRGLFGFIDRLFKSEPAAPSKN